MRDACVPPDQTLAAAHWLQRIILDKKPFTAYWLAGQWQITQTTYVEWLNPWEASRRGYVYLRPVPTMEEEDMLRLELLRARETIEELRDTILAQQRYVREARELTTALDERASETQEREWRVL